MSSDVSVPERLRADEAYSSRAIGRHIRDCPIGAVVAESADQAKDTASGAALGVAVRPRSTGPAAATATSSNRNAVERGFCHVKRWCGLITRYDKHALTFRGGTVLKAIVT